MAATPSKQRMTPSEAFIETLVANGVKGVFGIVGSAYMDAHDLFPLAGIRFISTAHDAREAGATVVVDSTVATPVLSRPRGASARWTSSGCR